MRLLPSACEERATVAQWSRCRIHHFRRVGGDAKLNMSMLKRPPVGGVEVRRRKGMLTQVSSSSLGNGSNLRILE
ncbi:hypothetical protein TNCV_3129001 [Trichonephila clavipes]|nr:hypothetical protein TNCV_3129001 [Trichonephila clavipes]